MANASEKKTKTGKVIGTIVGGGLVGLATGEVVGAALTGVTAAKVVASTETAISTLNGAAATNATLAALGVGALSAGGGRMAAGQALLTRITATSWVISGAEGVKQAMAENKNELDNGGLDDNNGIVVAFKRK